MESSSRPIATPSGVALFEDERLRGPITVTALAPGRQAVTLVDVNAKNITLPMSHRDPISGVDDSQVGSIEGKVTGFWGEYGLEPFPAENNNIYEKINLALVQTSIRNVPLSSMSASSVLEPLDTQGKGIFSSFIPPQYGLARL